MTHYDCRSFCSRSNQSTSCCLCSHCARPSNQQKIFLPMIEPRMPNSACAPPASARSTSARPVPSRDPLSGDDSWGNFCILYGVSTLAGIITDNSVIVIPIRVLVAQLRRAVTWMWPLTVVRRTYACISLHNKRNIFTTSLGRASVHTTRTGT